MNAMMVNFEQIHSGLQKRAFPLIGSGSGRNVYDLGNGYAVKVAKNKKGVAQNKAEFRIASVDRSNIFAQILQASDDYKMLIMEKANKVESITEVWEYFHVKSSSEFYHLGVMKELASKHHLLLKDLGRAVNWGKIDGRPAIIDYGFTRSVKKKYYSLF